jgi:hypothetical protein
MRDLFIHAIEESLAEVSIADMKTLWFLRG